MNRIPSWILRWGTTVIFGVVSFIIIGSYWFKYPDKINAQITLTMLDPPTYLVTKVSGKVDSLLWKWKRGQSRSAFGINRECCILSRYRFSKDVIEPMEK